MKKLALILSALFMAACGNSNLIITSDIEIPDLPEGFEPAVFEYAPQGLLIPETSTSQLPEVFEGILDFDEGFATSLIVTISEDKSVIDEDNPESGSIFTCQNCVFSTKYGKLQTGEFSDLAVESNVATAKNEKYSETEILPQITYISKYFPKTEILPITITNRVSADELGALIDWIEQNLPENALIIGMTDFSTHNIEQVAEFHDMTSLTSINNFEFGDFDKIDIAFPQAVYVLGELMAKKPATYVTELSSSSSADNSDEYLEEISSYKYLGYSFKKVESEDELLLKKGVSIMSVGNLPEEHTLEFTQGWKFDPEYNENADLSTTKLLRDIRGVEDKFIMGSDFYVFDLITDDCLVENKNGMQLTFCKFSEIDGDFEAQAEILDTYIEGSDLIYVLYEFQGGEVDNERRSLATDFIDAGVDVFVGRGISETAAFKTYEGGIILYSLGDFITDNKLATQLESTSQGAIMNLYVTPDEFTIYLLPVEVTNGYPKIADYSVRGEKFSYLRSEASYGAGDSIDEELTKIVIER